MMIKTLLSLGVLAALTGCAGMSSPAYDCTLAESPEGKCASMEQAYAAMKRSDPRVKSTTVFDAHAVKGTRQADKPFFRGQETEGMESGQQGMPVFEQPKVHRVWVAPYVDADGNLRTGEYTYFNTAGKWNYGTTRAAGAASGSFGPAKPGNLGFVPVEVTKKGAQPAPAAPPKPATPGNTQSAPNKPGNDITQPYQKLTD